MLVSIKNRAIASLFMDIIALHVFELVLQQQKYLGMASLREHHLILTTVFVVRRRELDKNIAQRVFGMTHTY